MKLKAVILCNFRCYRDEIRIPIDNITAFVGKNDAGKSAILEALDIFFNSDEVKMETGVTLASGPLQIMATRLPSVASSRSSQRRSS